MDLGLRGRAILITGGSKGIGLACAEGFIAEGCRVAIVGRDSVQLEAAAARLRQAPTAKTSNDVSAIMADLSTLSGVERMVEEARRELGRIDVLINNAGSIRAGAFMEIPDQQWIDDWNLKLLGYVRAARAVFPLMQEQGGGRIINVIGSAARQVIPNYLVGGAANAALVNFTKGLSDLGARHGIFVKAASPGAVQTERWENRMKLEAKAEGRSYEEARAERIAAYPLGRIVQPHEVADLVMFLASPRSDMLNGATLTIDGGWSRGVYP
ncbi:MAG TPA: SDR family oxidoreductase [Burkholderiaceae bacterium]|jgi:3-oxoacyl-[acyl-carrier protein] reductase|nr:SDR family oxidoreductase [Burkholderiaceae bacterium]